MAPTILKLFGIQQRDDFDGSAIEHTETGIKNSQRKETVNIAFWDPDNEWIDIRLRALAEQFVDIRGIDMRVHFSRNEEMRTEISTKFTLDQVEKMALEANINPQPRSGKQEQLENLLSRLIYSDSL